MWGTQKKETPIVIGRKIKLIKECSIVSSCSSDGNSKPARKEFEYYINIVNVYNNGSEKRVESIIWVKDNKNGEEIFDAILEQNGFPKSYTILKESELIPIK